MSKSVAGAVAAGDDQAAAAKAGWSRRIAAPGRARLLWAGALLLVGLGLFTLYLHQSRLGPFNSDGAGNILQAQSMLHGNLLLSGWTTSDVSFYTTELPEYMLVVAFRGLRPEVVHICGALTYTLTVLLAALLARGRATGRAGVVRALLAAAIMIAPSIAGGTEVFLEDPDHAGTAVPILLLLLLLDRAPERWYVPAGGCALLAWVQVADPLTLIPATAPVAVLAIVRLLVLAARGRPRREFRYDALLLVAAGASVALASLAERAIRLLGGFHENALTFGLLSPVSQIPANVRMTGRPLLLLFGANTPDSGHGTSRQLLQISAHIHLIGLALAAAGFAAAIILFFATRVDRVKPVVAAATLPLGAVLAGRMLPPLASSVRWLPGRTLVAALAAWLAAGLAALCFAASWAPAVTTNQELADWLVAHHYTSGVAGYWQSSSTTVASGGKVMVAPISYQATTPWHWESQDSWYQPGSRRANFVVAVADPTASGVITEAAARRSFGRPAHQYQVGQYVVMVYDYNLLTRLS